MGLFGKDAYSYNKIVRKAVVLFGSLFSDVMLMRGDTWIHVPLRYGRGNIYEKVNQSPEQSEQTRLREIVPSMSFYDLDLQRSAIRQTNPHHPIDLERGKVIASRTPYDLTFELAVRNKNIEDHLQILEQVGATFNPTHTAKMTPVEGSSRVENVVITLEGVATEDNFEEQVPEEERRIVATFTFTVRVHFYTKTRDVDVVEEVVYGTGTNEFDLNQSLFVANKDKQTTLIDMDALNSLINDGLVETVLVNPNNVSKAKKSSKRRSRSNT